MKKNFGMLKKIIIGIILVCVLWILFSNVSKKYEESKYGYPGQLVTVKNEKLHVYTKGTGTNTIVLLPGLGTASPVLDFEPLIDELSKKNKVVVVEPLGYGWSDLTDRERSVENITYEIREAIKKVGVDDPFVLMAHSLSGIYSMYYANKYPSEIKGIVGIDPSLPQTLSYFKETAPSVPNYMGYLAPLGMTKLAVMLDAKDYLPIAKKGVYSEKNLIETKAITSWKLSNKTVVNETNSIQSNSEKTRKLNFPNELPILIFARERADGNQNIQFYETQIENCVKGEVVPLKGHHYLHWTRYKEITEQTNSFFE
ncbi:alpha/beta fold hydrolase [Enterococcus sp. AZ103]|uniref:alpha/beta fold hydrolase n=1 Tax=Enterococcus sp. AZ103 TaxID=2774628 RepID=UPI003F20AC62